MNQGFTIPKFQLPGFIARIGEKLPQWPHAVRSEEHTSELQSPA